MAKAKERHSVTVIMLNFNGSCIMDITERSVEALLNQSYGISELIIVDDKSTDGSLAKLEEIAGKDPRISVLASSARRGVAGARNFGLQAAKGDIIAFIDNDAIPENNWIEIMLEKILSDGTIGACAPMTEFLKKPGIICSVGSTLTLSGYGRNIGIYQRKEFFDCPEEVLYPTGNGMMVRKEVLDEIGGFDDGFLGWGGDDMDLGIRLHNAGYKIATVPQAVLYHLHSYSKEVMNLRFWNARNTIRFLLKYYSWKDLNKWFCYQYGNILRGHAGGVIPHAWFYNIVELPALAKFRSKNGNGKAFIDRFYPLMFEGCAYSAYPDNSDYEGAFNKLDSSIEIGVNEGNYIYDGWYPQERSIRYGRYMWAADVAGVRFSLKRDIKNIVFSIIPHSEIDDQEISVIFRSNGADEKISVNIPNYRCKTENVIVKKALKPGRYETIFVSKKYHVDKTFLPRKIGFGLKAIEVF